MTAGALWVLHTKAGRYLLAALGFACLVLAIYLGGVHHEKKVIAARDAKAVAVVERHEAVAQTISTTAADTLTKTRVEIQTRTVTLIKKVPIYVPASADRDCIVPTGFVRVHDAAAAGLPETAGGPDQAPSGVPLSAIAATVVANYGVAYDWRAEAMTWRGWYAEQKKAWDAK